MNTTNESSSTGAHGSIHGYTIYNICGDQFELPPKYGPPFCLLGRGAYGNVSSAVNTETNEVVAIKKIRNAFEDKTVAKRILREVKISRKMGHENVVLIKDIIRPPRLDRFEDVYIVLEYMETNLHQIIRSRQTLTENHRRYFLYQLLRGLKYVHSANVLHRDLKPSNLLLNSVCDLKICDFGLARVSEVEDKNMTEYVVTRWYRAPELLLACSDYTAAIDVWSVGCIFMEILGGQALFPGQDYVQQLSLITEVLGTPEESDLTFLRRENHRRYMRQLPLRRKQKLGEKYPDSDPAALDLIEKMLVFNPENRITVEQALSHPYLARLHDDNDEPVSDATFDFAFERQELDEVNFRELMLAEILEFNPLPDPAMQRV